MSSLTIKDLSRDSMELDRAAMKKVRGGNSWLQGLGPIANVNVGVNQNITQIQNVEVNALNNVGVIGAGFGPLKLDVSPSQWASADAYF
ncbi:hypothetical protein [Noviherbaspirillum denitrificans]|uniref:Uncharacterized protein n=1 Tax=Noviherbaspirillum denitrificans TaxID=1968433 RepID=A0A254T8L3_9BURK|nr:hypothetical protein [Noviherbaspirillum denitrificans]OWW18976.1 hypothetical protein AYR66_05230 [Noviherbaspirillum denitrificans]